MTDRHSTETQQRSKATTPKAVAKGLPRRGGPGPQGSEAVDSKAVDESSEDSFPASDPPASHGPDDPPANAEAKWRAAREHRHRPSRP